MNRRMSIQLSRFRSLLGANPVVLIMKGLLVVVLIWMFSMFTPILDFSIIRITRIVQLFESVRNIVTILLYYLFFAIWMGVSYGITYAFSPVPLYSTSPLDAFRDPMYQEILRNWLPTLTRTDPVSGTVTTFQPDFSEILTDLSNLTEELYILVFQIFAILMIIYAVRSVLQNDPKYAIKTITWLNVMIVVPLLILGIQELISVFAEVNISDWLQLTDEGYALPYPLRPELIYYEISDNFGAFLSSNIFQVALSSFVYLELSFQLNYVYQVTSPTEKRAKRLKYQIEALKRAAKEAVVDLEKIKQEQEEEKNKEEIDEEGNIIEKEKPTTVRKFLRQKTGRLSFISEMIERRKLEEETKKLIEAKKDTRRLSNYLNQLLENDPEAEYTLTARTSAPTAGRLITSTVIDMAIRLGGITLIVFLVAQTVWVLTDVMNVPAAINESVELLTKEVILTLLIPLMLAFPLISVLIRGAKQQHLKDELRAEEERRMEALGILPAGEGEEAAEEEEPEMVAA